jgi:tRNA G46 methylase TrmB
MKDLAEILDGSTAGSILEIGCGRGQFLQNLVESLPQVKRVVGVDIIDPHITVMPGLFRLIISRLLLVVKEV